jgi:hypothetical protein
MQLHAHFPGLFAADAQRRNWARIVESGPIPAVHGVVRWRFIDLAQCLWESKFRAYNFQYGFY